MKNILIKMMMLSMILGTRICDLNISSTLDNNRSCGQRPILNESIISPSGHFKIHYNNYYDGINDYAYNVAIAADSSRKVIVDEMDFRSEVSDEDGLYDIYIEQLPNGSYGWNCPDGDLGQSWVEIDDNYIGTNYGTTGLDAMRISIAHEYFHAIQRAYVPSPGQNSFFYELSSIWIEDIVFPDIDDYISFSQIGDSYFSNPEENMNTYKGYGLGLYGHYMNFKFDNQIMQRIWDNFSLITENGNGGNEAVFNAIDNVLSSDIYNYSSSFSDSWIDFNARNLYNGEYDDMDNDIYYYEDQKYFQPISTNQTQINDSITVAHNVNNRSVSINSYSPIYLSYFKILNNFNHDDVKGLFSIFSDSNEIFEIQNFYESNILFSDNVFHTLYISNTNNSEFQSLLNITKLNTSDDIFIYPNPILNNIHDNIYFRFNNGITSNQILLKLYNLNGDLLKSIKLGSINYTKDEFNLISSNLLFNNNISSGLYILSFEIENQIINIKITYLK